MSKNDWIDGEQLQYDMETGDYVVVDVNGNQVTYKRNPWLTTWTSSGTMEPLTKEEQQELATLTKEHEELVKAAKIEIFKKSDRQHRQFIVNIILTNKLGSETASASVEKSDRLKELEAKEEMTTFKARRLSQLGGMWGDEYKKGALQVSLRNFGFPDSIKDEDLIQAHLEACMEEDMLGKEN